MITADVYDDNGNTFVVEVTSRTVLRWERQKPGRKVSALQDSMRGIYEVVHIAAVKAGKVPADMPLADFEDAYDVVPRDDEDENEDPTQPAA